MLESCKLDPILIGVLVEIWRPATHTFHLSYGKCTITVEDVALQLGLLVDGSLIMGLAFLPGKEDLCEAFLGKVLNKFQGGWIDMKWLENNFKNLPKDTNDIKKEQYVRAFILRRLSWGSTVLATLYTESFRAAERDKMPIGGWLLLLLSLYIPINAKVEPWVELYRTTRVARRYSTIVRSTLEIAIDKPYLLSVELRSRQPRPKRPCRLPQHRRPGASVAWVKY
ncbi:hypothetical protein Golob_013117 [Gossypium lobatum]|uniref:Aminotransferase-like plant mobile domain-containing protein n=1 Tax=Gossypium lobatum TaxID=34289 RepID=A0A7J8LNF6_9ROSI|nr:hypothetical protein [Gossypium lobatum]